MKIMDEKGRLFGRINVIDFIVILFLLCLTPIFYFAYKVSAKKPEQISAPIFFKETEIYCKFAMLSPEILKMIAVGDKQRDENNAVIGEIIWLGEAKSNKYVFDLGAGEIKTEEDPILKELPARLKLKAKIKSNSLYYDDRQIMINSPIEFKTDKYTISAIPDIEKIESIESIENTKLDFYVILKGIDDGKLKLISAGDRELDAKGDIAAEILNVGKVDIDTRDIALGAGMYVLGEDSNKKQIFTKMRMKCELRNDNILYFKGERLEYNSLFEFKTDKYTVMGKMAKAYETPPSPLKEKWVQIQVKFQGVILELANVVEEGDVEKDPAGKIVGRLKKVIAKKPSEMFILGLKQDMVKVASNPFLRDITVYLDIRSIEKDGILYFKNYPLKMGNTVTLSTDLYSISGVIVGMVIE